jgi:hypothetical protein
VLYGIGRQKSRQSTADGGFFHKAAKYDQASRHENASKLRAAFDCAIVGSTIEVAAHAA